MKMKKSSIGNLVIAAGSLMISSAVALAVYNIVQDNQSGKYAQELLNRVKQEIPEASPVVTEAIYTDYVPDVFDKYISKDDETYYAKESCPLINIDGNMYTGILGIPRLSLELPVYDELNYDNLKNSPCRYKGSTKKGNIIIAAHNYNSHFGSISEMITGDMIYFTDAQGNIHEYSVIQTETVDGSDTEAMEYGSDEWDITIFTCTLSGKSRVTVRAARV